jgi:hypothetical protein
MLMLDPPIEMLPDGAAGARRFRIKATESDRRRGLLATMLEGRPFRPGEVSTATLVDPKVQRFTLAAVGDEQTIGTVTVVVDGRETLPVAQDFPQEVAALRAQGRRLCEFTRLAIDPTVGSKRMVAALVHVAYIVAHRLRGFDTLLMAVHPRHADTYARLLGCRLIGPSRVARRSQRPEALLALDFAYVMSQIGRFGGHPELAEHEPSLYPFTLPLGEEASILDRLRSRQQPWPATGDSLSPRDSQVPASDLASL